MKKTILIESDFKQYVSELYKEEQINYIQEKWDKLNKTQKTFVVEFLKSANPDKSVLVNESTWMNTLGDVIGIFDPTGVVDIVNGISYLYQGDLLFGFLSMISAIPYAGDAVAKPLMAAFKIGKPVTKALDAALVLSKAGKTAEAAKAIEDVSKTSKLGKSFVNGSVKWGPKLKDIINKIPGGRLTTGLRKTITDWIDLFLQGAQKSQVATHALSSLAKKGVNLTTNEIKTVQDALKGSGFFKGFKISDPGILTKFFNVTSGYLWRNPSLRSLVVRTKWWMGLLKFMKMETYETLDSLTKKMSPSDIDEKISEYNKTPEAQSLWSQEMSGTSTAPSVTTTPPTTIAQAKGGDFLTSLFSELLGGSESAAALAI